VAPRGSRFLIERTYRKCEPPSSGRAYPGFGIRQQTGESSYTYVDWDDWDYFSGSYYRHLRTFRHWQLASTVAFDTLSQHPLIHTGGYKRAEYATDSLKALQRATFVLRLKRILRSTPRISKEEQHRGYRQQADQRDGEAHQEQDRLEGQVRLLASKVDKE
jgi:hypothetical protein